jgi:hypothetical protein
MTMLARLTLRLERLIARPLLAILRPLDLEDVEIPTDD